MNDFWIWLGDFFSWTFRVFIRPVGNYPNLLFIAVMAAYFLYWMSEMLRHKRAGEN